MNNGLSVGVNWETRFNGSYLATESESGKHISISKIEIPGVFEKKIIRIFSNSISAKPSWWYSGQLIQLIQSGNQLDCEVFRWSIPLKVLSLIEVKMITSQYTLKFQPAKWLKDIAIVVEQYTGE